MRLTCAQIHFPWPSTCFHFTITFNNPLHTHPFYSDVFRTTAAEPLVQALHSLHRGAVNIFSQKCLCIIDSQLYLSKEELSKIAPMLLHSIDKEVDELAKPQDSDADQRDLGALVVCAVGQDVLYVVECRKHGC
jgi:hypothetical protein